MERELDIFQILKLFRRRIKLITVSILFCMVTSMIMVLFILSPKYEAKSTLLISMSRKNQAITTNQLETNSQLVETYKRIIYSDDLLNKISTRISANIDYETLKDIIVLESSGKSQTFNITAKTKNAAQSVEIANTASQVFQENIEEYFPSNLEIKIISKAKETDLKVTPRLTQSLISASILGLLLSCTYILMKELFR